MSGESTFEDADDEQTQPLMMGNQNLSSKSQRVGVEDIDANDHQDISSTAQLTRTPSHPLSTTSQTRYRTYRRRFIGLSELILLNIIVSWNWIAFASISSTAATYFSVSESTINWLSTAVLFAFVIATPLTFYALGRYGPKTSIVVAACLLLVGNWIKYGGARSNQFAVVMLGQLLIGFAQPFVLSAPTTYSDIWFSPAGRTTATAISSLANPFGAALGQLISPFWVSHPSDVPNSVLWVAIIATAICLPAFFIPSRPPTPPAPVTDEIKQPGLDTIIRELRIMLGSLEFWLIFVGFSVYVGFFNALSSLLNQILEPYGFSQDEAGIAGAILIVAGLVSAAITSPLNDKYKFYIWFIKVTVPTVAIMYLIFYWAPPSRNLAFVFVISGILGAASFSLVPVVLEYLVEILHPLGPSVSSALCWSGGQLLGGSFIVIMDALKASKDANPPQNMSRALVFQAVIAMIAMPFPVCLGLFGRKGMVRLRRLEAQRGTGNFAEDGSSRAESNTLPSDT